MMLKIVPAYSYPREVGELFTEYTDMLIAGDSSFKQYLDMQHYDEELAQPAAKYGMPAGRLYLALWDGEAAGCVGLRRLDAESCEMKRLYVRPAYRGRQIGCQLVRRIIADAREIGYGYMLLDTLPFLTEALQLYKKFGFCETACYNDSPLAATIYLKLAL